MELGNLDDVGNWVKTISWNNEGLRLETLDFLIWNLGISFRKV
jgi:hypothetical protein